jgi:hypothetical protein
MAKGFFTQGVCIMLSRPATLDEIQPLLGEFRIVGRNDDAASPEMGGPSFTVEYLPDVNGYVIVDCQDRPWPDHMGDPKKEPMLFGAWSMGHYGPLAYPGNLERAAHQSWAWEGGKTIPGQHRAFLRVRSTYVLGARDEDQVMPDDYEPLAELMFVTRVSRALLKHPAALAYFNPNGETLRDEAGLAEALDDPRPGVPPPLDIWSNIRLLNPGNGWMVMDTVGNGQLDRPDCEACFPKESVDPGQVDNFLRNVSLYLIRKGEVINDGDTIDGPGGVPWRARHVKEALTEPPRPTLRFFPADAQLPPEMGR